MEETVMERQGASERLLRELIKSPKFKASLKVLAGNIDPATAPGLAKTLLWQDVDTFLGTVSALPSLVNFLVALIREIAAQLNGFPPPILIAFMSQLVKDIDFAAMREAVVESKAVLDRLEPVLGQLKEASSGVMEELGAAGAAAE